MADPRVTKTAMMADLYLPLKPRSDLALINAILRILIDEELYDKDYVEQHTTGFAELRASLEPYTVDYAANITGLSPELIRKTALLYGNAKAAFIGWTMGVNHSTKGTETVNAINNLALITGNIGRSGASPFSITGQCNAMGTREAGFSSSLPGYRKFESEQDREELARLWDLPVDRIPTKRGFAYPDIIEAAVARKIRALWIIGTNPLVSFPNIDVAQAGSRESGFPRRPGWFSSDSDNRIRRSGFAGRHLGRKGRNLHQLRAPREQSKRRREPARGSAKRFRHLSRGRRTPRLP